MKKQEWSLPTNVKWGSIVSKYSPESAFVSPDSFTSGSSDFITHITGDIEKRWSDVQYNSTALTGPLADQFEMIFQSGERNLLFRDNTTLKVTTGDTIVTDVFGPLNLVGSLEYLNYQNLCYIDNGIDTPIVYDLTGSYGGVAYLPVSITVVDYSILGGKAITLGPNTITEGADWTASTDNDTTALSIESAINAISGVPYTVSVAANVVSIYITVATYTEPVTTTASILGLSISASTSPRIRPMGVVPPSTAPTFASDSAGGSVPDGGHKYKVSFLYMGFEESNPSVASALHTVAATDNTVNLTAVAIGGYGVTARNIYRDDNDGVFLLVGTILDNTTTTFTDSVAVGTTPAPTTAGLPPTFGLSTLFLSRAFVAKVPGSPSSLYWSDPGELDIWNPANSILCNPEDVITALVVYQGTLYVFSKYSFGSITGNSDSTFAYNPISTAQIGCVDNRSIQVRAIDGYPILVFLSAKGVYGFNGSSITYISDPIEDVVNLNIVQGSSSQGSNSQSTFADWSSGSATPGIDISTGVITLQPTEAEYSGNLDWATGVNTNTVTKDVSGLLSVPLQFAPSLPAGSISGNTSFTTSGFPAALTGNSAFWQLGNNTNIATKVTPGTISRNWFLIDDFADNQLTSNPTWSNNGCTVSGNAIHAGSGVSSGSGASTPLTGAYGTFSFRAEFGSGTKYVRFIDNTSDINPNFASGNGYAIVCSLGSISLNRFSGFSESGVVSLGGTPSGAHDYRITRTSSGLFTVYIDGSLIGSGTDNAYVSNSFFVVGNNGPSGSDVAVTNIYYSPEVWVASGETENNSQAVAIIDIDQLITPTAEGTVSGTFTTPSGTSIAISTATSADDITYTSFVAVGVGNTIASPADRYLRIKFVLVSPIDSGTANGNLTSPSVSNLSISWSPAAFVYNSVNSISAPTTGTWTSTIYDTKCDGNLTDAITVDLTATYPTNTSATVLVEGATDSFMASVVSTTTLSSPTTTSVVNNPNAARYWRVTYTLDSSDGLYTPALTVPIIDYDTTAIWVSPTIDCTTDVTGYNALSISETVPVGTTTLYEIATSADDMSYSAYGPVGSAVVERYVKIKATLTGTGPVSASLTQLTFTWDMASVFTSSVINAGVIPSGIGLFQATSFPGGGTIAFTMATASSPGGLVSATFVPVTSGQIAVVPPNQYIQWKAFLTGTGATAPEVQAVTINWNIGVAITPVRVTSLFFDKTYYLSAATTGQTINNIVIAYDYLGSWRIFRDINISSMGLFFQQPHYLDGVRNNIYQWQIAPNGVDALPYTMDIRTKAFNLNDIAVQKNVRSLWVSGTNTGTTIHGYFSTDRGANWIEMLNSLTGTVGYTTASDGLAFNAYFVPDYSLGETVEGTAIMFRVTSSDAFPCQIGNIRPCVFVRSGKYIGMAL